MNAQHPTRTLTRRSAIGRLGLIAFATALAPTAARATTSAPHPMVGDWLATTPLGPAHLQVDPGGTLVMAWPQSEDTERGTFAYTPSAPGFWQPVSDRGIHLTVVRLDTEVGGVVTGTTSLEGIVVASADGATFKGEGAAERMDAWASVGMTHLTLREAATPEPALSGIRMWPEPAAPTAG